MKLYSSLSPFRTGTLPFGQSLRRSCCALVLVIAGLSPLVVRGGSLAGAYTDPNYLLETAFGNHSHWLQAWRAYLETVPASTFLDGTGVVLNDVDSCNQNLILQMLATHGIGCTRIEEGWSNASYTNPAQLNNLTLLRSKLLACQTWGVRPHILLNSNHGFPCPAQTFNRTVTATAAAGSNQLVLNDVSGLVLGKSGYTFSGHLAFGLVTAIQGNTVTLSQGIPAQITANTSIPMATLKFTPFSDPQNDATDYNATIAGWKSYVQTVATTCAQILGTTNAADKGFDLEIWNELTFGSDFLYIDVYYNPPIYPYTQTYTHDGVWAHVVQATVDVVNANPSMFSGVALIDGFANTVPWPASSTEPARVGALSHHPYPPINSYPANEQGGGRVNALGQNEGSTGYVPTYNLSFPEYFGTAIQTESSIRDMGPINNNVGSTVHGRYARSNNPCPLWITEIGWLPQGGNGITNAAQALALKARTTARFFTFYINKGTDAVTIYDAGNGDLGYGIIQDNFVQYAKTNTTYPANDSSYVSPALAVTSQIAAKMTAGLDPTLTLATTRPLQVTSISDAHNHSQFMGDGTSAHPNLFDREVLALLPYQVNASRFVIPYYVVTRDVRQALAPEIFSIALQGLKGIGTSISAYDPINKANVPLTINSAGSNTLSLTVTATDYPYLLIVDEPTYETETLTVAAKSAAQHRVIADPSFSGGSGSILDATVVGDFVTYLVPAVKAGTYNVRIGVKTLNTRGIWQLAIGRADNFSGTKSNVGAPQDEYSAATQFREFDLGLWSPGTTSDKWFQFAITGKNAASTGFSECFDYIKLIPQ